MQKIIIVPNLHLPSKEFIEWAQNLAEFGPEIILFEKPVVGLEWKQILTEFEKLHQKNYEKGSEIYYLTEGRGLIPVLEKVESRNLSGIFSVQPIISLAKKAKKHPIYENSSDVLDLIKETSSAVHLFLPQNGFENDYNKSIKHLKSFSKPNIAVQSFETSSLLSSLYLDEIKNYVLHNLRLI